jgi:hypothetical protein
MLKEITEYTIQAKNKPKNLGNTKRQEELFFYFINNMSLQTVSTLNNKGFWNSERPQNHKFHVGKENILKKISKKIETRAMHGQPEYVRRLYIIQTMYVRVLYREHGAYTSVNFQKKRKSLGRKNGKGKLLGT